MPNTKSAKKRLRQNLVRRTRNRATKSLLKTAVKKVRESIAEGDVSGGEQNFRLAAQKLDRGQLTDWLLSRDVTKELRAIRLRLARRLIEDLREGHDWPSEVRGLPPEERDRLRKNLRDLAGVWLVSQSDQYARLPEADRGAFLDDQLKDLTSLPVFAGGDGLSLAANAGAAVHEFEDWARDLPPDEDQRLRQLLSALSVRWLQQGFQRFLPGGAVQ